MPKTQQAVEQAAKLKLYLPQLDKLEESNWGKIYNMIIAAFE